MNVSKKELTQSTIGYYSISIGHVDFVIIGMVVVAVGTTLTGGTSSTTRFLKVTAPKAWLESHIFEARNSKIAQYTQV